MSVVETVVIAEDLFHRFGEKCLREELNCHERVLNIGGAHALDGDCREGDATTLAIVVLG